MEATTTSKGPLIDIRAGAAFLTVSERKMYDLARRGKVPSYRVGSVWRFREAELEEWLQQQRRGAP